MLSNELRTRRTGLLEAQARMPNRIEDADAEKRVAAYCKQLQLWQREAEKERKAAKEPHLEAGRQIDREYAEAKESVSRTLDQCKQLIAEYKRRMIAEEEAERRRKLAEIEAERQRQREIAEAAEAERQRKLAEGDILGAMDIEMADPDPEPLDMPPAPVMPSAPSHGYGATSKLETVWECSRFDRDNLDWAKLGPYFTQIETVAAIKRFIADGNRELRGATIEWREVARIR